MTPRSHMRPQQGPPVLGTSADVAADLDVDGRVTRGSPSAPWRFRQVGGYTMAMYFVRIAGTLKNVLLASLLGPTGYGLVAVFLTLLGYSIYLDFGVLHAVYREVPLLRGARREEASRRVVNAAYGAIIVLSSALAAILLAVSVLQAGGILRGNWWFTLALALAVAAQQLGYFPYNVALADGEFGTLAWGITAGAAIDLGASAAAALVWGAEGAVAVASIGFVVQFLVIFRALRPRPRPQWDLRRTLRLAQIGIPIALIWFGNTNFIAMDKLVALVGLGQRSVGIYALAASASTLAMIAPGAIAIQFGPRILRRLADTASTDDATRTARIALDAAGLTAAPVVAVAIIMLPALTALILPSYVEAVRSAQILVVGGALLSSTIPIVTYAVGRNKQWKVVFLYGASALFNLALDVVLLKLGRGIEGIAIGSLTSYFLFAVVMRKLLATLDRGQDYRRLLVTLLPILWASAVGVVGVALLYQQHLEYRILAAAAAAVVAIALVAPVVVAYLRLTGFRSRGLMI